MDTELSELVATFPDSFLTDHHRGKKILRDTAKDLIDVTTIERNKVGFKVPIAEWFQSSHRSLLIDLLQSKSSTIRNIIDDRFIDGVVNSHLRGHRNNEKILWALVSLEVFIREYKMTL